MLSALEAARDALREIEGVASCKIGIEAAISPADYPMIRVVPVRATPGRPYNNRTVETVIYFGCAVTESQGLELVYEHLFDLEASILEVLRELGARYLDTVTDEDRLDTYKLMAIRCELTAERVPA